MGRILIIRGGAIGDFLLTLPAVAMLRRALPDNHLAILGYRPVIAVAEAAGLADEVRSMEHGPLARFFVPGGEIDVGWRDWFTSFDLVISYLWDPDDIFHGNLRRIGVPSLLLGAPKVLSDAGHAVDQLAEVLAQLAIFPDEKDRALLLRFGESWRMRAREFLGPLGEGPAVFAIHPGSGSPGKNWDLVRWREVVAELCQHIPDARFLVATGEAEEEGVSRFLRSLRDAGVPFLHADSLPLPLLGAALGECRAFAGHDSGIGHLAALAGTPSVLLFGPTPAKVWAPPHTHVRTVAHRDGEMAAISVETVVGACLELWNSGSPAGESHP